MKSTIDKHKKTQTLEKSLAFFYFKEYNKIKKESEYKAKRVVSIVIFGFATLLSLGAGMILLRNGKITKNHQIPAVYLAGFNGFFFGFGSKVFGVLIIFSGLGFLSAFFLSLFSL